MKTIRLLTVAFALAGVSSAFAGTITFEGVPITSTDLGNYYQGVTFGPGIQVTSTSSGYPAHSGSQEAALNDAPSTISFAAAQPDVSFWYTTLFGFAATAYDSHGNLLATKSEASNSSGVTGTDSLLDFGIGNISSVVITDDVGIGGFISIDDLSAAGISGLPAPDATSTLGLLGVGVAGLLAFRRKFATR